MQRNQKHYPPAGGSWPLYAVLYAGIVVLLYLSLHFYSYRAAFSDTPGYIVDMTKSGGFIYPHYRFVCVINQWLPALLLHFNASLRSVAIAYSFGYALAPVILIILSLHWLRQPATALSILLLFTLMNMLLFYYNVSELQMGLAVLLFYDGVMERSLNRERPFSAAFWIITLLAMPTVAFCHPMGMPTFFMWVLYRLTRNARAWKPLLAAVICFVTGYAVKKTWFVGPYEVLKAVTWEHHIRPFGLNYYSGPIAKSFYHYLVSDAFLVPCMLAATVALLIMRKAWRQLAFLPLAVIALYTLVLIVFEDFSNWNLYDHYYEHYMQPVIVMIILCFCASFTALRMPAYAKALAVAAMLIISFAKIITHAEWHRARQGWELSVLSLMDAMKVKKATIMREQGPEGIWLGSYWDAAYETLVLSAMQGPDSAKTLFMAWNYDHTDEAQQRGDMIVMDGWHFEQQQLPRRYFRLNDQPYVTLEKAVPDSVLHRLHWQSY